MARTDLVIHEEDHTRFVNILTNLRQKANARFVLLLDKTGQQIANVGDAAMDATSLASLSAGNVAATEGLGQLIGEPSFSALYHEGQQHHMHISLVTKGVILLLVFDETSSLGLVRLRVQQTTPELANVAEELLARSNKSTPGKDLSSASLDEITDADIDALFG